MVDFDAFVDALRGGVTKLVSETLPDQQGAALRDANTFVASSRADLERWTDQLERGEITRDDFEFLVRGRQRIAEMQTLARAGVARVKIDQFLTSLLFLIIVTAIQFVPRASAPAETATRSAGDTNEFDLGVGRGQRAKPPRAGNGEPRRSARPQTQARMAWKQPRRRVVSTGFADTTTPSKPRSGRRPLEAGAPYYYWFEIGEPVAGAVDASRTTIPDAVPIGAELTVALFVPDGGFSTTYDLGRLRLLPDGTARVLAQPASHYEGVPGDLLEKRLLFPLWAPRKRGRYRLRSSIYCQGVLVQSRLVEAYVGKEPPKGQPAVVSNVDYTLSNTLPPTLGSLEPHSLSIMVNKTDQGSHDFCFYGTEPGTTVHRPVTISAGTLNSAIKRARKAMREASWGDGGQWSDKKTYRYETIDPVRLREDLANLAGRGFDVYNLVVANLTATGTRSELEKLLKSPGTLQIAGKQDIRFVLPAGMIYDYKIDNQLPLGDFQLCPVFAKAFRDRTPLLTTQCFQGACPTRGNVAAVCPSGFWGFRHRLGLPISLGKNGNAADIAVRVEYKDVPVIVVGVSTDKKLKERVAHQGKVQQLQTGWQQTGWFLGESRQEILELLAQRKPHLVYFYCHGGVTEDSEFYLSVGTPGKGSYILPSNLDAYVSWEEPPHPLVFINGCHTTALDADTTLEFVTQFVQVLQACGVIGTEITVFESLAGAFATHFWRVFLKGDIGVGEAIRHARLELLQEGNPLGLVYTPFVFAGTKLEKIT